MDSSARSQTQQEEAMVVVIREQARKQLEEELLRREKEQLAGAQPKPVDLEQGVVDTDPKQADQGDESPRLMKNQRRCLRQQCQEEKEVDEPELTTHSIELAAAEIKGLQDREVTLEKVCKAADRHPCSVGVGFCRNEYRRWTAPQHGEGIT